MHALRRRKFLALLLALVLLLVLYAPVQGLPGGQVAAHTLLTVVFLAAFWVVWAQRPLRLPALVLGLPALAGAWTHCAVPGLPRVVVSVGFHGLAALFLALTITAILWAALRSRSVSAENICGALCGYLLAGVAFGHLYCLMEDVAPGSFRASPESMAQLAEEGRRRFLLTYFSFVTLATLGYGDITPAGPAARGLAVVEAVVGQFYVAVLIAELVGRKVAQAVGGPPPDPEG